MCAYMEFDNVRKNNMMIGNADRRTDGSTDTPSYRVARTHLKSLSSTYIAAGQKGNRLAFLEITLMGKRVGRNHYYQIIKWMEQNRGRKKSRWEEVVAQR